MYQRSAEKARSPAYKFIERLTFQHFEILSSRLGGICQPSPMCACGSDDSAGRKIQKMSEKLVRMLCLNTVFMQIFVRKVSEIIGDNNIGAAANGGGKNMAIPRVGKMQRRNQIFEIFDKAVPYMHIHKFTCAPQGVRRYIGTVIQHRTHPLIVNQGRPFRVEKVCERQLHQEITKRRRIEDARIIQCRECGQFQ